ncbi:MAG: DEAD/DEAH box helicase [Myxococcales bacterium]|nr:DEAD/DEAH box helicase [Myxococcales bacterium]
MALLRPVQELTIDAMLDGCNTVVLAPTAGGRRKPRSFPVLSRILTESLKPVSVLYVCPIRALLNNQEERLQSYARMVGLEVFKWHGDVSDSRKQRFREAPAHILMTTPESLEVMMISARTDARAIFAGLSAVVIDEVHAFAADDRGAHLVSAPRAAAPASASATSSASASPQPSAIRTRSARGCRAPASDRFAWSTRRARRPSAPRHRPCGRHHAGRLGHRASAPGKKSLVFVESRSRAEKVAHALGGSGVEVFVHHSAVSRADRRIAEEQFTSGQNTAIVCTSTMELGIDVGDLDLVLQVDAPSSVASMLQRTGRTGRRPGTRSNCTFFCLTPESLLQAIALSASPSRAGSRTSGPPRRRRTSSPTR